MVLRTTSHSESKTIQVPFKNQEHPYLVTPRLADIQPCQAVQAKLKNNIVLLRIPIDYRLTQYSKETLTYQFQ